MKVEEIRDLSEDAVLAKLNDTKEELMKLRFQQASGELTDYTRLRQTRRTIARLYTILKEKKQADKMEGEK
jgi:large subunit ribosomal protein L29